MPEKTPVTSDNKTAQYDPFGFYDNMRKLLNGFLQESWLPSRTWPINFGSQAMALDVTENQGSYKVVVNIPGVKKEDIAIDIEGKTISISAEIKEERGSNGGDSVIHSERHYGKLFRRFDFDNSIDSTKASAKYSDDVLELILPKKNENQSKKITVQ
ncbi:Hsp20/alpha crystallin family protein [Neisseriaceae bacterium JH1-16]|nr:Hsp20/alpha crystallin family protein [Neisseriaceae bacterium JH1-16]